MTNIIDSVESKLKNNCPYPECIPEINDKDQKICNRHKIIIKRCKKCNATNRSLSKYCRMCSSEFSTDKYWLMFRGNSSLTSSSPAISIEPKSIELLWKISIHQPLYTQIICAYEMAIVSTQAGMVLFLSLNPQFSETVNANRPVRITTLPGRDNTFENIIASPMIINYNLYIPAGNKIYVYNLSPLANGMPCKRLGTMFTTQHSDEIINGNLVGNEKIVAFTTQMDRICRLYLLDPLTMEIKHQRQIDVSTPWPIITDDKLVLLQDNGYLYVVDLRTYYGNQYLLRNVRPNLNITPFQYNNKIYFADVNCQVNYFSLYNLSSEIGVSRLAIRFNGMTYLVSDGSDLIVGVLSDMYYFENLGPMATQIAKLSPGANESISAPPIMTSGYLVIPDASTGNLIVFSRSRIASGVILGRYPLGARSSISSVAVYEDKIIAASSNGDIACFQISE